LITKVLDCYSITTLGELEATLVNENRKMSEDRNLLSPSEIEHDRLWCSRQVLLSANDMSDMKVHVIDEVRQYVQRGSVPLDEHKIFNRRVLETNLSPYEV
jgi:hypothetical protein